MRLNLITKKIHAILVLLAFASLGWSQGIVFVHKNIFVGQNFSESPGQNVALLSVTKQAKHGTATALSSSTLSYTPNAAFRGLDTFAVQYKQGTVVPTWSFKTYVIKADYSFLSIKPDYAFTAKNQPVTIDVLANDNATTATGAANLDITGITLINNGASASIVNDKVVFTPTADFVGIAYLNYVACDNYNCSAGSVAIVVNESALPNVSFSRVSTSKNTPVSLLLANNGFAITTNGKKGTATLNSGNAFTYVPNTGITGKDTVSFYNTALGKQSKIEVEIFNKATQNQFAIDDYAYTPRNQAVTIDVTPNDKAQFPVIAGFTQPNPTQGTVSLTNGKFTFTPVNGFSGIAKFTYLLNNASGLPATNPINEWATVNVVVSDFYPAKSVFHLSTPINTPLVLNYKVPITGYNFTIVDSTQNGALNYYAGQTTLNFAAQGVISGQNLVVYAPTQGFAGTEQFELLYCINGNCRTVKFIIDVQAVTPTLPTYCVGDCIWAGDSNNDGIVDMADLLPIGYCQGEAGLARANASNNWFGQFGSNWNNPFMPGQDLKYIDTNGDGDVSAVDTTALSNNFLKAHNIVAEKQANYKATPFFLQVLTPNPQIGDYVEADLLIGKQGVAVTDLYGFTMDFQIDQQTINEQSLNCSFYNSSWLTYNSPTLRLSKKPMDGKLYMGYVRTNGSSASGFGKVAKLGFIIEDDIAGIRDTDGKYYASITLKNGKVMGSDGAVYDVPEQRVEIPISKKQENTAFDANKIAISPNPTADVLNVYVNGSEDSATYDIINLNGQSIANGTLSARSAQLNVSMLPNGLYFLKVITKGGVATKKFEVVK